VFYRDSEQVTDLDNLAKTVLDAGQPTIWPNDSQVVELLLRKALDRDHPRTWLRVWRLDPVQEPLA
jgi:Holliday junction resolvase RusA-like endonuclease